MQLHWDEPIEGRSLMWTRVSVIMLDIGVLLLALTVIATLLGLG